MKLLLAVGPDNNIIFGDLIRDYRLSGRAQIRRLMRGSVCAGRRARIVTWHYAGAIAVMVAGLQAGDRGVG